MRNALYVLPFLALTGCSSASTIAKDIGLGAPLVCPEFAFIPAGAQVCSGIAGAVQAFFELWAETHPTSATAAVVAAVKARKATPGAPIAMAQEKLVRVGSYGLFPAAIAAELAEPEMAKAFAAYLKAHPATTGDAGAPDAAAR